MKLKLQKELIEKTLNEEGVEVQETQSLLYEIVEVEGENEYVKGNVHISQNSVSFSIYNSTYDIHEWKTKIEGLITTEKEITE